MNTSAKSTKQNYLQQVRTGVLDWVESVRYPDEGWGRWKYHARMVRPWSLNASGIAVRILHLLGALDEVGQAQRDEAIALYLSCQDPADHLFKDPLEVGAAKLDKHPWEYVWGQRNGETVRALQLLGAEATWPRPRKQFADLSAIDTAAWTRQEVDWTEPWMNSEIWSKAIQAYANSLPAEVRAADDPPIRSAVAALIDHVLNPDTGYPDRHMDKDEPWVAMAGCFKLLHAFGAIQQPYPYPEAAIDSTLQLQNDRGTFAPYEDMAINWDALLVLYKLDQQLEGQHRHAEIARAGDRFVRVLFEQYRRADGAFAFNGATCLTHHASVVLCDRGYPISDMLGTIMSLMCLSYVDEWNGQPLTS